MKLGTKSCADRRRGELFLWNALTIVVAYGSPDRIASRLDRANQEFEVLRHWEASAAWNASIQINIWNQNELKQVQNEKELWKLHTCTDLEHIVEHLSTNISRDQSRQISLFCRGPKYTPELSRAFEEVQQELYRIYHTSLVCYGDFCEHGEPELARRMEQSRDPQFLLTIWHAWRHRVGPKGKPLYRDMVQIMNQAARRNGYDNVGAAWKEVHDLPKIENEVKRLYDEILPFYQRLHAWVRFRLSKFYGEDLIERLRPLPAHLLGNMWAQSWEAIADLIVPEDLLGSNQDFTLEDVLAISNLSVVDMAKSAEEYFVSMGFQPMTSSFWRYSQLEKPVDPGFPTSCHPSSLDLYNGDDFRIELCGQQTWDTFLTLHHEMGHIQYYMNYHHQPPIFRDGANPSFHESIGDCINYGIQSPAFLKRFGLKSKLEPNVMIGHLLKQALSRIPLIVWSYVVDQWRWDVFSEKVPFTEWNDHWWDLREQIQGVQSPLPRHPDSFDPMAKFHIPDNSPYIPYFFAGFLQVQLYERLCQVEHGSTIDVHQCDLWGAKRAGHVLRSLMSAGQSQPWKRVLMDNLGMASISAQPLLRYYDPLIRWLDEMIERESIPIGW
ncbi:angiotensin-converting enzyme-like [Tigriopus californicus]|uniref:angiotensin-converting enzyme-like n=1 Tax=Tigriopus californicus TaxID=6832 RepID=UPI0027D9E5BC|nr:angiotensin-converting enzyme-like [Tigriopus californicus]